MKGKNKKTSLIRILALTLLIVSMLTIVSCGLLEGETPISKTKLAAPYGLRLDDGFLCWNPVEYATRYVVSIDGKEYYCSDYKYSLSAVGDGEHVFRVKATGDDILYQSSDFSAEFKTNLYEGKQAATGYYSQFDDLTKNESFLGYGFDVINSSVFSDKYVKTSFPIFNTDELMNQRLLKVDSKYVSIDETQSSSIEEFMASWNANANVNVSWGKTKIGGSVKVKAAYSGGVENAASKYFHCISFTNQKFYIVMQSDMATYRDIISDSLKADLYSDMDPATLFDRYGTHFITSAVMGGKINSYYLYTSSEEKSYHDISGKVSTEVRYLAGKTTASVGGGYKNEATAQNIDIRNTLEVIGGGDFGMTSDADLKDYYAEWEKSLDDHASLMGIKDTGSLQPIWQLIDPELDTKTYTWDYDGDGVYESGTRAEQLQTYFFAYGVESYNDLLESAGLPELVAPTEITSVQVNGADANNNGEYEVFAGIENDITFTVLPTNAVGYNKVIALSEASDFASINDKNQLVISPNAPHNTTLTIVLSAGNVRKQIKVRVLKSYTVEFETNCDIVIDSLIGVRYGKQIVEPVLEKREGYEFIGWYTTYNFIDDTEYKFGEQAIVEDLTLYAKWQRIYPVVTFKHNVEKIEQTTLKMVYGQECAEPEKPKFAGYTFLGWYTDDEYVEKFDFSQKIVQNTNIYGKWVENPTVTFISNVGEGAPEKVTVVYNTAMDVPETPKLEGHAFLGWYADSEYTEEFDFTQKLIKNTNIYVKYVPYPVVTFISNVGEGAPEKVTVVYNTAMDVPETPKLEGHAFLGWYADSGFSESFDFTQKLTKNTKIYVKWEINKYTVFFESNGGTAIDNQTVLFGNKATKPETIVKPNYEFAGWYKDADCLSLFDFNLDTIKGDTTLYAKWSKGLIEIVFDTNCDKTIDSRKVEVESSLGINLPMLTRVGYEFVGWYTTENFDPSSRVYSDTKFFESITLYARWDAKEVKLSFDRNGGDGIANSKSIMLEKEYGELPVVNKAGYEFLGWFYEDTLISSNTIVSVPEDHTLVAKWNVNPYEIGKYVSNGTYVCDSNGTKYFVFNDITRTPKITEDFVEIGSIVIIDWSSSGTSSFEAVRNSDDQNTHLDIHSIVDEIYFIGNKNATYSNVNIFMVDFDAGEKLILHLHNFNMDSESSNIGSWYKDGFKDIGMELTIDCHADSDICNIGAKDIKTERILKITGEGKLTVRGKHGSDGYGEGASGSDGQTAIYVKSLTVDMDKEGTLYVYGGNGGNGSAGYKGADGAKGADQGEGNSNKGGNGGNGNAGGTGGAGGMGAAAIVAEDIILNTTIIVKAGDGGDGGAGGAGGNGGAGGQGGSNYNFFNTSAGDGGDGGYGGAGGTGGKGGDVAVAIRSDNISGTYTEYESSVGNGGAGGAGGFGGTGGPGGWKCTGAGSIYDSVTMKQMSSGKSHASEQAQSGDDGLSGSKI